MSWNSICNRRLQETLIFIAIGPEFEDAAHFLANACPEACKMSRINSSEPLHPVIFILKCNNMISFMTKANLVLVLKVDDYSQSTFDCFFCY